MEILASESHASGGETPVGVVSIHDGLTWAPEQGTEPCSICFFICKMGEILMIRELVTHKKYDARWL